MDGPVPGPAAMELVARDVQHARLSHLPQRPPVHLSFQDLSYGVPDGGKGDYTLMYLRIVCKPSLNGFLGVMSL
ncbi:hypothetical protein EVAR_84103_1 [Eumeta japonica]|uniref:Uncharacterized protein n=1 Tax=Eumeta variegata TaxID=151549 RepID=A0A4C1V066_EUMVA|nr:hypothetical protein EVAR_84103_1 [Eumeta japonica]